MATINEIKSVTNIRKYDAYLEYINKKDKGFAIFYSVKDTAGPYCNSSILGASEELEKKYRYSFLMATVDGKKIEEQCEFRLISTSLLIENNEIIITSSGFTLGNNSHIIINGIDYSVNKRGMNIVVYDYINSKVIDSVCFDTFTPKQDCYRSRWIDPYSYADQLVRPLYGTIPLAAEESKLFTDAIINMMGVEKKNLFKYFSKATGKLRILQLSLVRMLNDFHNMCIQNNIKYWMMYGSLLGTVRHEGFIPWDDDVDIGVLRKDFDKLFNLIQNSEKYETYLFVGFEPSVGYHLLFKFCTKDNIFPFIDIFIFDEVDDNPDDLKTKMDIQKKQLDAICYKYNLKSNFCRNGEEKNVQMILKDCKITTDSYNNPKESLIVLGLEWPFYKKNIFPNDAILPLKKSSFEGIEVLIPNDYMKILEILYGDIYKLPAKKQPPHYNIDDKILENCKKILNQDR